MNKKYANGLFYVNPQTAGRMLGLSTQEVFNLIDLKEVAVTWFDDDTPWISEDEIRQVRMSIHLMRALAPFSSPGR